MPKHVTPLDICDGKNDPEEACRRSGNNARYKRDIRSRVENIRPGHSIRAILNQDKETNHTEDNATRKVSGSRLGGAPGRQAGTTPAP
jgi:hypothetical protein